MNELEGSTSPPTPARARSPRRMVGADVLLGCSAKGMVTQDMIRAMAEQPHRLRARQPRSRRFSYPEATRGAQPTLIMATGRSDYPNQVNNVLGFPYIFRGALDVRATAITEEMKLAAVARARRTGPRGGPRIGLAAPTAASAFSFGREYIIPKPLDQRVLLWVAPPWPRPP